ncbi:MAG TPA: folylpolyglutamate synthase/dihydrofolate synthase family protein [Geobacteraceae bacterium]
MTYQETLAYIYGLGRFGMKPGLERISAILQALDGPQNNVKSIHVAGTNGKGSTAAFLASIGAAAGLKVGLFTSPHLSRFTERIRINGAEIEEEAVVGLAGRVIAAAPPNATFFELVTAMAWLYFHEREVDVAIMETGMGGRFDATNAACGIISVITPISLDHSEYLGKTPAEIAFEKAGVIKPGRPVVSSLQSEQVLEVIEGQCAALGSPLYRAGRDFGAFWESGAVEYRGIAAELHALKPGIAGRFQVENAACALAAAEILGAMGYSLPAGAMRAGIEGAAWPGRMEFLGERPRILLDGAHNPAGGYALAEALGDISRASLILVAGVMGDKDAAGIFTPLFPLIDRVFTVSPVLERACPSDRLAEFFRAHGIPCEDAGSVAAGIEQAKGAARPEDLILICGSLFAVGEARAVIRGETFEPFRG